VAISITLAVVALVAAVVCALGWRRTAARLGRLERRVVAVEREVRTEVMPELDRSRRDSEAAVFAARRATAAVGIEEPPPRLAAESVTAPVVRAVAFGAGARRAIARFTADVAPLGKTRKVVTTMSRVSGPRRGTPTAAAKGAAKGEETTR
jgi:hypothetical protein